MNKKDKIEKLFKQINNALPDFGLAKERVSNQLFNKIEKGVTVFDDSRFNIQKMIFKLNLHRTFNYSMIVILAVLLLGGGVGYAADMSVSGDFLYPLDRKIEQVSSYVLKNKNIDRLKERTKELEVVEQKEKANELLDEIDKDFREEIKNIDVTRETYYENKNFTNKRVKKLEKDIDDLEEVKENIRRYRNKKESEKNDNEENKDDN